MKRISLRAAVAPTAAALALGLSLTACGAGNEESAARTRRSAAASGGGLSGTLNGAGSSAQEAAQGAWTAGLPVRELRCDRQLRPERVRRRAWSSSSPARVKFAGSDAYLDDEQLAASKKVCGDATALEAPAYISPIALAYNLEGVDKLQLSPDTAAQIFAGKITKWNDPAIKADNPDADAAGRQRSPRCTARTTPARRRTSPTTCTRPPAAPGPARPTRPGPTSPARAPGHLRRRRGRRQRHGHHRVRRRQPGRRPRRANIKVGDAYVAPDAEAAAKVVDVSKPVSGRADTTWPSTWTAPPPRPAPTRSCWCPT